MEDKFEIGILVYLKVLPSDLVSDLPYGSLFDVSYFGLNKHGVLVPSSRDCTPTLATIVDANSDGFKLKISDSFYLDFNVSRTFLGDYVFYEPKKGDSLSYLAA